MTVDDRQQLELALVENLQRTDLGPLDRSQAYRVMLEEFELTQEAVAEALGVSRSSVANALRLLNLDGSSLDALRAGEISEGHARALLSVADVAARGRLLAAIKNEGLSVREAERWTAAGEGEDRSQEAPASRSPTESGDCVEPGSRQRAGTDSAEPGDAGAFAGRPSDGAESSWSTTARKSWRNSSTG